MKSAIDAKHAVSKLAPKAERPQPSSVTWSGYPAHVREHHHAGVFSRRSTSVSAAQAASVHTDSRVFPPGGARVSQGQVSAFRGGRRKHLPMWLIVLVVLALSGCALGGFTRVTTFLVFGAGAMPATRPAGHAVPIQAKLAGGTVPVPLTIVAQDTFTRPDQSFWGTASDGQRWGADANTSPGFSVVDHMGTILNRGQGNLLTVQAILGPRLSDADVVFSGSLSLLRPGASNLGAVVRWAGPNNWYKAYIDGAQLVLLKNVAGAITRLSAVPFPAQNAQFYTLRFRVVGSMLMARVWPTGQAEPATWMVMEQDSALPSGFGGLRVVLQDGAIASIAMFLEVSVGHMP